MGLLVESRAPRLWLALNFNDPILGLTDQVGIFQKHCAPPHRRAFFCALNP
jgi:hypothetical protein